MHNNEQIACIIQETSQYIKSRLVELVEADASGYVISTFANVSNEIERSVQHLGERSAYEFCNQISPSFLEEIVVRLDRIEKFAQNPPMVLEVE